MHHENYFEPSVMSIIVALVVFFLLRAFYFQSAYFLSMSCLNTYPKRAAQTCKQIFFQQK